MDPLRRAIIRGLLMATTLAASLAMTTTRADLPDVINSIRPSLVSVGTFQRTRNPAFRPLGTGFVVGDGTLVATNAHVMPQSIDTAQLEALAIVLPRNGHIEIREVEKTVMDASHDLMVLRMKGAPLPPLRLGDANAVREGQDVAFSGFPIPSVLGLFSVTHKGIIASISPIGIPGARANQLDPQLIRQLAAGAFDIIQLDAPAYPGHSGSPVYLTGTGEVIAILNSTFVKGRKEAVLSEPSGISYAIPVRHLQDLLKRIGAQ